jgi:alpha-tubulin suppressor-like RCC1 family protein
MADIQETRSVRIPSGVDGRVVPHDVAASPRPLSRCGRRIVAVAACGNHSLALQEDGTLWCWGDNTRGQLGNGTRVSSPTPVKLLWP